MKKTIRDINIDNKKIIVRVDFNVPIIDGHITNDNRIISSIPTIKYLLSKNASIILISHLGRPNGKFVKNMSLKPVAKRLGEILNLPIKFIDKDCISNDSKKVANNLKSKEIFLLENLRFHTEEEGNDSFGNKDIIAMENFAKELSNMGNSFVQDAFGTAHRFNASTVNIVKYMDDAAIGFLVEKELKFLNMLLNNPKRPFLAVLGGAKVSDKIGVIKNLINKVDSIIIGGAMAYTFLKAKGINVGASIVENDKLSLALDILNEIKNKNISFMLPIDHIVINKADFRNNIFNNKKNTNDSSIPKDFLGVDIGNKSINIFKDAIKSASTIIWNGPVGMFEINSFSYGTMAIAKLIAIATKKGTVTIVGGGDSISAISTAGVRDKVTHVSTGGGASLKFLEGKKLPGLDIIPEL
ncbi:MAG: phosphoglycerate kinase [Endomicrobium sp.]|jgi:phosphoglycerate kinase|nr:phosphoglycerate kinase [Endomicrobium sp.]